MRYWYFLLVCISLILPACHEQAGNVLHPEKTSVADWKESLQEKLPLLGHRNWIVVTDMAYPLQAVRVSSLYMLLKLLEMLPLLSWTGFVGRSMSLRIYIRIVSSWP